MFGPDSTQEQVFGDVAQLVTSVLDGYNVCIFAYGQTGAAQKRLCACRAEARPLAGIASWTLPKPCLQALSL